MRTRFKQVSSWTGTLLPGFFYYYGRLVGKFPIVFILLPVFVTLVASLGLNKVSK